MLERVFSVSTLQMIIAMKGDAYTGKTTCADAIAKSYRCSVISFDHILDSLSLSLAPSTPQEADDLTDLAFDVVLRVVKHQLRLGRPAVVDSPLSNPSHLDKLLQLADEFKNCGDESCDKLHCRFVIVECRPEAKYSWELKFKRKCTSDDDARATEKWYKPKEWSDVVFSESAEHYPPGRLPDYVCRLIVDTTGYVNFRHLGAATLDLIRCPKGHLLNFRDWLPNKPVHSGFPALAFMDKYSGRVEPEPDDQATIVCGNDGRHLLEELPTHDGELGRCAACTETISSGCRAYACKRCNVFALHESCAELKEKTMIDHPEQLLPILRKITSPVSNEEYYSKISKECRRRCGACKGDDREFSVDCESCLWTAHLRLGGVPTILYHEGHHSMDHSICFWITSATNAREYQCAACKEPGWYVGYTCLEGTFRFNLHVECALLRYPRKHVHGRHDHVMKLVFSTDETTDDYYCDECLEPREPTAWYYSCASKDCSYVSHLHCIYA